MGNAEVLSSEAGIWECYDGSQAFQFLLRVAAGLESQIIGETDIFGQLKEAWRQFSRKNPSRSSELSPWIQKIFEDTKEVRARYLQNLGGASYGSLVRKVMGSAPCGPVLLLGAGALAKAVAPYFLSGEGATEVVLWNRTSSKAHDLRQEWRAAYPSSQVSVIESIESGFEKDIWKKAAWVVVCAPIDLGNETLREKVIHLGLMRTQSGKWSHVQEFYALDDLFRLQNNQEEIRSIQVAKAVRFCEDRAKLRALSGTSGGSLAIAHGWEDLAAFA